MSCPALLCWSYDPKECAVGALCVEEQPRISSPCVGPSVDRISDGLDKLAEERAALQAEFSQQLVEQHAFIFEVPAKPGGAWIRPTGTSSTASCAGSAVGSRSSKSNA